MTSGMNFSSIKIAHQVREFEEKRSQERKRNLLCLIHQYLRDEGYHLTAEAFESETHIAKQLTVCDNIDLSTVLQEYETYYFLRFQKYPKICKKSISSTAGCEKQSRTLRRALEPAASNQAQDDSSPQGAIAKQSSSSTSNLSRTNGNSHAKPAANVARVKSNMTSSLDITLTPLVTSLGLEKDEETDCSPAEHIAKPFSACYTSLGVEWKEYVDLISKEIFVQNTDVEWNDVKGLDTAKTLLKESVVYPNKYPELFKNILTPWRGLLLFGPPGTGKTLLAKAVARESQTTFFNISASSIMSKWRGESEKLVRVLFEMARQQAPSTIFIDELDCMASKSDHTQHEASRRLKSELLIQLDGLAHSEDRVFFLATSNVPWDLDPAMLRRLEKRILVDLPSAEVRELMIGHHLPPKTIESSNSELKCNLDYNYLAQAMEGYSGCDIRLVCKEAAMCTMRKAFTALETSKQCSELEPLNLGTITDADVMKAVQRTRPSTCHSLLDRYRVWNQQFGST